MPGKRTNLPPNPITMKKPGSSNKIRGGARSIIDPDGEPQTHQELQARIAKLRAAVRHLESAPLGSRWERIKDQQALDAGGTAMDVEQSSNVEKVGVEPSVNVMDVEPPNHVEMDGVESPADAIGEQIPKEVDAEVPTRLRSENPGGSSANINSGRTGAGPKERESIGVRKLEDDLGKGFEPSRGNKSTSSSVSPVDQDSVVSGKGSGELPPSTSGSAGEQRERKRKRLSEHPHATPVTHIVGPAVPCKRCRSIGSLDGTIPPVNPPEIRELKRKQELLRTEVIAARADIAMLRKEFHEEMIELRRGFREEMTGSRSEVVGLRDEFAEVRSVMDGVRDAAQSIIDELLRFKDRNDKN